VRGLQDARKRSRFPFSATALKIHVSPKTKEILDTFGTFELVCRGEVVLKVSYLDMWFFLQFYRDTLLLRLLSREPHCRFFLRERKDRTRVSRIERDCQVFSQGGGDVSKENDHCASSL